MTTLFHVIAVFFIFLLGVVFGMVLLACLAVNAPQQEELEDKAGRK